ncbi:hypothetical protein CSC33_6126 [Pseudomonas aeruginosa]|nr:hypothetical protein CSC33_6126 [Pseudomonas aeruginosa]
MARRYPEDAFLFRVPLAFNSRCSLAHTGHQDPRNTAAPMAFHSWPWRQRNE